MSIKLGTQNIVGLYKGTTEIVKRYKGSSLIYESFKWLPFSYEYLYNSLIPTTIDNKNVKDKAKVSKIYANGIIENQLVQNGDFSLNSGWYAISSVYSFNISNNTMTATKTTTGSNLFCYKSNNDVPLQPNHKYFCVAQCKASSDCRVRFRASTGGTVQTLNANATTLLTDFITTGSSISGIYCGLQEVEESSFRPLPVGGTIETKEYRMFDLTLMFGTGNEPTTLTDNRIQALLNRGYIAYNTGTYKSTDISEFSSEPYNLFDGEWEQGRYDLNTGLPAIGYVGYYRSKNKIKVIGGRTYTISRNDNCLGYLYEYDKDNNFLGNTYISTNTTNNFVLKTNTAYINFTLGSSFTTEPANVCFHLTGTRTGYATHQTFSPLSFIYQGNGALNSHDTFEITSTEYVFTKNAVKVVLFNITFNYQSGNTNIFGQYLQVGNNYAYYKGGIDYTSLANSILIGYTQVMPTGDLSSMPDKSFMIRKVSDTYTALCIIRDDTYNNDVEGFRTFIKNQKMWCELNTPQVIRIPKKHLGIVDLGSLNYGMSSAGRFYINATTRIDNVKIPTTQDEIANIYCKEYMVINGYQASNYSTNLAFGINSNGYLYIRDDSCSSIAELQAKLSGVYLFYETENEVGDIADTIGIEKGGTITSNSQVLPNVDFNIKCK